jgi:hypothetical protein
MPKIGWGILSLTCLAVCLGSPVLYFLGRLPGREFRLDFFIASVGWFVFASLWARRVKK